MTVSQVKKRFSEFESYLRHDKEGIRRLKLLKDDVNELRTSLAEAERKADIAEDIKNAARDRADKAEEFLEEIKADHRRLEAIACAAEARLKQLEKEPQTDTPEEIINSDTLSESTLRAVIKNLRNNLKYCPKGMLGTFQKQPVVVFDRVDFTRGWSRTDLYVLGASIALLSTFEGQVLIREKRLQSEMKFKDDKYLLGGFRKHFFQWFQDNIRRDNPTLQEQSSAILFKKGIRSDEGVTDPIWYGETEDEH